MTIQEFKRKYNTEIGDIAHFPGRIWGFARVYGFRKVNGEFRILIRYSDEFGRATPTFFGESRPHYITADDLDSGFAIVYKPEEHAALPVHFWVREKLIEEATEYHPAIYLWRCKYCGATTQHA